MTVRCHRLVGAIGLVLFAANGCGPQASTSATTASAELPTVVVTVAPVQAHPIQRTVEAVGTLRGYEDSTVSPKVGGRVAATYVDLGDMVFPGQVVLEIDPVDYLKDVDRARRALALELARLDLPELQTKAQFQPEDVPAVRKAKAALDSAQREYDRVAGTGGISGKEKDTAVSDLQLARASYRVALTEANAGLTAAWLRKDELDVAELRLADCTLRVPFPSIASAWAGLLGTAGNPFHYTVAQKLISEGETAQSAPKTDAFRLVMDRALKLPLAVPEKFAGEVHVGQVTEVRVDAYPDRVFLGTVHRVSSVVDPLNRTFYPVVAVLNLDRELKAGGFARAAIRTRQEAVKAVPPSAVVSFAGVDKVFLIDANKAKAVEVTIGTRDKEWVEVVGDLPAGSRVATSGFSQLVDGSPVRVRE